jgi:phospholipid/cholesterol/gamma-HCH transport system substrate-binding protein
MKKTLITTEIKVGILVLIGVLILFYMSFKVEKFGLFREEGYELSVILDNASGLDIRTPVFVAGVQVGNIKKISLSGYKAKVRMLLSKNVKVPVDSTIAIKSQSLLGDKYIEIIPGVESKYFAEGDKITNVSTSPDFDQLFARFDIAAKNIGDTMGEFKGILGEDDKVNIKKSIENIQVASSDFRNILGKNKDDVDRIISSTAVITNKMETIVKDVEQGKGTLGLLVKDDKLYNDAKDTVTSLKSITGDIEQGKGTLGMLAKDGALYSEVKETFSNVREITDGIKKGEGTLGKLAKDDSLYLETEKALKKVQKGAESLQEMAPITILGTIFGFFF